MAAPLALFGLPLIGGLLTKLFELFLDVFLKKYTFRLAMGLAFIALMFTIFLAFSAGLAAVIKTVYFVGPPELSKAIGHFLPESMPAILGAYFTTHVYEFVWNIKKSIARAKYNYLSGR